MTVLYLFLVIFQDISVTLKVVFIIMMHCCDFDSNNSLQCFDTVGRASGRASGL